MHGAGEEGNIGAQNRNKTPEEDHLSTLAVEHVPSHFELALVQADLAPITAGQGEAALHTYKVAGDVPRHSRNRCHREYGPRV